MILLKNDVVKIEVTGSNAQILHNYSLVQVKHLKIFLKKTMALQIHMYQ